MEVIGSYIIFTIAVNFIWWIPCSEVAGEYGLCFCNPKWIYNHTKANWFGTALLTILVNVIFGPAALCYWFYKLCTVGRR